MIVAGVMSGTSADGINVALVRIQGRGFRSRLELLAHYEFPYPPEVRKAVLHAMNASSAKVADLARLNFTLGELYAKAVAGRAAASAAGVRAGWLPWADPLPSRRADQLSRPRNYVHMADRRRCGSGGEVGSPGRLGLPSGRFCGWRQGRSVGAVPRLHSLSPSPLRPHRAKHRWHRKSDRDSAARRS